MKGVKMKCPRCKTDNLRKYHQYKGIISYLCKKCGRIVLKTKGEIK